MNGANASCRAGVGIPPEVMREFGVKSRYRELSGFRCHYIDEGSGDAVVMVHGNPTWSFFFRRLIKRLAEKNRVIALDHIGCGLSDKPAASVYPYTLERRAQDLGELLAHLVPNQRVTLVLHDWGGMIGMAYAVRQPESIARLVLMNTGAFPLPTGKALPASIALCRKPLLGPLLVRGLNLFSRGAASRCAVRRPLTPGARQGLLAPYNTWRNREAVLRFVQDIPLDASHPSWRTVVETAARLASFRETPTMIAWGARDFVFDDHFLSAWKQHLPQAEIHRFEDAGHYLLEDAWEDVLPLTEAFLARYPC